MNIFESKSVNFTLGGTKMNTKNEGVFQLKNGYWGFRFAQKTNLESHLEQKLLP